MSVDTIGIRDLRNALSRRLAEVREGNEIIVTDHGAPIARIVPYETESGLEALVRRGVATLPSGPRHVSYPEPIATTGTISDLLEESSGRY